MELDNDGLISITTMGTGLAMPLIRYSIGDDGGLLSFDDMIEILKENGIKVNLSNAIKLPFVWVFGRKIWTISFYGANIYCENIMVGLEQPCFYGKITGKFTLNTTSDISEKRLLLKVEMFKDVKPTEELKLMIIESVVKELKRLNSEFANYVPAEMQAPLVELLDYGDPYQFPIGVKHVYIK